jgi:hypothetical protein
VLAARHDGARDAVLDHLETSRGVLSYAVATGGGGNDVLRGGRQARRGVGERRS